MVILKESPVPNVKHLRIDLCANIPIIIFKVYGCCVEENKLIVMKTGDNFARSLNQILVKNQLQVIQ